MDVPLDANGQRQAVIVGQKFAGVPLKMIFSSPLQRTLAVAQQIASVTRAPITTTPALMSWDRGQFTGQPEAKVKRYVDWYLQHPSQQIPGGESFDRFIQRDGTFILHELQMLERNPDHGPVANVTHAHNLNALLAVLSGGREPVILDSAPPPGSIIKLEFDGQQWRLAGENDTDAQTGQDAGAVRPGLASVAR